MEAREYLNDFKLCSHYCFAKASIFERTRPIIDHNATTLALILDTLKTLTYRASL